MTHKEIGSLAKYVEILFMEITPCHLVFSFRHYRDDFWAEVAVVKDYSNLAHSSSIA